MSRRHSKIMLFAFGIAIVVAATGAALCALLYACPHFLRFGTCSPMVAAVIDDDPLAIEKCVADGISLEARYSTWDESSFETSVTPLLLAARQRKTTAAVKLIRLGANVNAVDGVGHSVARILIENDDGIAFGEALKAGIDDPTFGGRDFQFTSMMMYIESNQASSCRIALDEFLAR